MRVQAKAKAIISGVIDGMPVTKFPGEKFEADKDYIDGLLRTNKDCVQVIGPVEKPAAAPAEAPAEAPAKPKKATKTKAPAKSEPVATDPADEHQDFDDLGD